MLKTLVDVDKLEAFVVNRVLLTELPFCVSVPVIERYTLSSELFRKAKKRVKSAFGELVPLQDSKTERIEII